MTDELLALAEHSFLATWQHLAAAAAGGVAEDGEEVLYVGLPVPVAFFNAAFVKPPHDPVTRAAEVAAFDVAEVGGYRESARDPEGHPAGLAADFMVYDDTAKGVLIAE